MASEDDDLNFDTLDALARWLDTPFNTVQTNWRKSGMPGERNDWSARAAARWLAKQYGSRKANSAEADDKRAAETRKLLADAEMKEFDLLVKRGGLRSIDAIRLQFDEVATVCRDELMRIPVDLRPMLPDEFKEFICGEVDGAIRRSLVALVERLTRIVEGNDEEDETEDGSA